MSVCISIYSLVYRLLANHVIDGVVSGIMSREMHRAPKTHIIYVSGLGDGYDTLRRFCLRFWRIYGVYVEFIPSKWSNDEDFETKRDRIERAAKSANERGRKVVIMGESAGGSLVLNVYARIPDVIHRVVTLCGKNVGPDNVAPRLYTRNRSFQDSMRQVGHSVRSLSLSQRQRITCIYALSDLTVPLADTLIDDCRRLRLWFVGHITTIFFGLTIGSFLLVREARRP